MSDIANRDTAERLLSALGEQLAAADERYALVDQGPGKHEADLRALSPTEEELFAAAHWSRLHDPSEGYAQMLRDVLTHLGVDDVDLGR